MTTDRWLVASWLANDRDPDSVIDSIDPEEATLRRRNLWRHYFLSAQPVEPIVVDDRRWYPYPHTSIVHIRSALSPPLRHPGAPRHAPLHRPWAEPLEEYETLASRAYELAVAGLSSQPYRRTTGNAFWQRTHASDEKKERREVNRAVKQDERPARMQRDAARKAQQRRARRGL